MAWGERHRSRRSESQNRMLEFILGPLALVAFFVAGRRWAA
jgi:hypothetical protein